MFFFNASESPLRNVTQSVICNERNGCSGGCSRWSKSTFNLTREDWKIQPSNADLWLVRWCDRRRREIEWPVGAGNRRSGSEDVDNRRSISACGVVSLGYRRSASLYRLRSTINRRLSFSSAWDVHPRQKPASLKIAGHGETRGSLRAGLYIARNYGAEKSRAKSRLDS